MKNPDLSPATWFKSSYSGPNSDNCVEIAHVDGLTAVRDSKDRSQPALVFTPGEWAAFVAGVKDGEFDTP